MLLENAVGQKYKIASSGRVAMPVVVSTWDSGITANNAAWPILQKGGRTLDAVEAAGRASENEPSCCVGLAAWPDRDGHVTLEGEVVEAKDQQVVEALAESVEGVRSVESTLVVRSARTSAG